MGIERMIGAGDKMFSLVTVVVPKGKEIVRVKRGPKKNVQMCRK